MKFTHLACKQFGKFSDVTFPLSDTTVFYGGNEAGKTTLCDAFLFALCGENARFGVFRRYSKPKVTLIPTPAHTLDPNAAMELNVVRAAEFTFNFDGKSDWQKRLHEKLFAAGINPDTLLKQLKNSQRRLPPLQKIAGEIGLCEQEDLVAAAAVNTLKMRLANTQRHVAQAHAKCQEFERVEQSRADHQNQEWMESRKRLWQQWQQAETHKVTDRLLEQVSVKAGRMKEAEWRAAERAVGPQPGVTWDQARARKQEQESALAKAQDILQFWNKVGLAGAVMGTLLIVVGLVHSTLLTILGLFLSVLAGSLTWQKQRHVKGQRTLIEQKLQAALKAQTETEAYDVRRAKAEAARSEFQEFIVDSGFESLERLESERELALLRQRLGSHADTEWRKSGIDPHTLTFDDTVVAAQMEVVGPQHAAQKAQWFKERQDAQREELQIEAQLAQWPQTQRGLQERLHGLKKERETLMVQLKAHEVAGHIFTVMQKNQESDIAWFGQKALAWIDAAQITPGRGLQTQKWKQDGIMGQDREGAYRAIDHLSTSTQALYYLALRVAALVTLESEGALLLLDEPFAHFDEERREEAVRVLTLAQKETGLGIVCFTKDPGTVESLKRLGQNPIVHHLKDERDPMGRIIPSSNPLPF